MVVAEGEIKIEGKDSAPVKDPASAVKPESTSPTPKTYTEADYKKGISDALADAGRRHKSELEPLIKERDTFRTQAEQAKALADEASATLKDTQNEIEQLGDDIKSLAESNPDSAELVKLKKELRAAENQLKRDFKAKEDALKELRGTAEKEREQFASEVSEAQAYRLSQNTLEIAKDFEGGDSEKLKSLCEDRIEATGKQMSKEEITKLAGKLWNKKTGSKEPDAVIDSGVGNGTVVDTPTSVRTLYATSKINTVEYEKRMRALGREP
jgi:vacuolar-type H+-ATPase subunit I/STV1